VEALGQSAQQTYNRELLLKIGMTGMSDEESDDDHTGWVIRIVRPAWRSDSLNQFLHDLDIDAPIQHNYPIIETTNSRAVAVSGLPPFCYSNASLQE